jgi:uncharacterized protein involved in propanediol utilization
MEINEVVSTLLQQIVLSPVLATSRALVCYPVSWFTGVLYFDP